LEYISYLWSDIEGVKTNKNVSVGNTEEVLLSAYPHNLYYLDKEEAFSEIGLTALGIIEYSEGKLTETINEKYDFDYAYMWQPFTRENNEVRDITFFIRNGKIAAIEAISPFELRHVYGYDREAGLQYTEEQRRK